MLRVIVAPEDLAGFIEKHDGELNGNKAFMLAEDKDEAIHVMLSRDDFTHKDTMSIVQEGEIIYDESVGLSDDAKLNRLSDIYDKVAKGYYNMPVLYSEQYYV